MESNDKNEMAAESLKDLKENLFNQADEAATSPENAFSQIPDQKEEPLPEGENIEPPELKSNSLPESSPEESEISVSKSEMQNQEPPQDTIAEEPEEKKSDQEEIPEVSNIIDKNLPVEEEKEVNEESLDDVNSELGIMQSSSKNVQTNSPDSQKELEDEHPEAPIKEIQEEPSGESLTPDTSRVSQDKRSKKEKLQILFWCYSEISEKTGESFIKLRSFLLLCGESLIIERGKLSKAQVEVIYKSIVGKKGLMGYNEFCDSIVLLAEYRYKECYCESQTKAIDLIISKHLSKLYDRKNKGKSEFCDLTFQHLIYDIEIKLLLNNIDSTLRYIYTEYFEKHFSNISDKKKLPQVSSQQILIFLKDFDLIKCNFTTKHLAILMMNILINMDEAELTNNPEDPAVFCDPEFSYGTYFTFSKFIIFLFWTAMKGFKAANPTSEDPSQKGKMNYMLEKMEFSEGLYKLSKIKSKTNMLSLLPSEENASETLDKNTGIFPIAQTRFMEAREENKNIDQLQKLFTAYCQKGKSANQMPFYKFTALLRDAQILGERDIDSTEIEIIYSRVTNVIRDEEKSSLISQKKETKFDFRAFYFALAVIGAKLYPNPDPSKSLDSLIENNLMSIFSGKLDEISPEVMEMLNQESVADILSMLKKPLGIYLKPYGEKKIYDYDTFIKFCSNFGVFPSICTRQQLHTIFYTLAAKPKEFTSSIMSASGGGRVKLINKSIREAYLKGEYLNEATFFEALGLAAFVSSEFDEEENPEIKIFHFAEKLLHSEGILRMKQQIGLTRLHRESIDPLADIKKKYIAKSNISVSKKDLLSQVLAEESL